MKMTFSFDEKDIKHSPEYDVALLDQETVCFSIGDQLEVMVPPAFAEHLGQRLLMATAEPADDMELPEDPYTEKPSGDTVSSFELSRGGQLLSTHPTAEAGEEAREAASKYGECEVTETTAVAS